MHCKGEPNYYKRRSLLTRKRLQVVFIVLTVACIACPIFIYYRYTASEPEDNHKNISHYKQRHRPRHEIRGFSFNSSHDGKKVISIKADRFSIKKKKLGFLSFGLMNEAKFDNAVIHIYGRSGQTEKTEVPPEGRRAGRGPAGRTAGRQDLTFKGIFSKGSLPSFQAKRISSIVMEPVCVELHDEQSSVTRISAASAVIRFKKRCILFKGNVRVVSGPRVLTTSRISLFPENAVIRTDQHFTLKTPEKELKGERLTSDIFLKINKLYSSQSHG